MKRKEVLLEHLRRKTPVELLQYTPFLYLSALLLVDSWVSWHDNVTWIPCTITILHQGPKLWNSFL